MKPTKTALHIRLYDTTDWGMQGSDSEHDAYEQLESTQSKLRIPIQMSVSARRRVLSPRVVVTTRFNGRILSDYATRKRGGEIAEACHRDHAGRLGCWGVLVYRGRVNVMAIERITVAPGTRRSTSLDGKRLVLVDGVDRGAPRAEATRPVRSYP